jgi:hypothetical protein
MTIDQSTLTKGQVRKLKYTQKQATKKGFNLVEEFLLSVRVEKADIEAK